MIALHSHPSGYLNMILMRTGELRPKPNPVKQSHPEWMCSLRALFALLVARNACRDLRVCDSLQQHCVHWQWLMSARDKPCVRKSAKHCGKSFFFPETKWRCCKVTIVNFLLRMGPLWFILYPSSKCMISPCIVGYNESTI